MIETINCKMYSTKFHTKYIMQNKENMQYSFTIIYKSSHVYELLYTKQK